MKTENLQEWVGKTEERNDLLTSFPANAMAATLNHEQLDYTENKSLPPLWHWLYFQVIGSRLRWACRLRRFPTTSSTAQTHVGRQQNGVFFTITSW